MRSPFLVRRSSSLGSRTLTVGPGCQYALLSDALAAITDASDSNEYLIIVAGEITETNVITAKSHVHVLFLAGASVTITTTSAVSGVSMNSLTNAVWAAADSSRPTIIRAGSTTSSVQTVYINACTSGVKLFNIYAQGTATGNACHGYYIVGASSCVMTNCRGDGGPGAANSHGIYVSGASPTLINCTGIGGSNAGGNCHGIYLTSSSSTMTNCTGTGGSGGILCHGIAIYSSSPTMTNCTGTGGSGGSSCRGIYLTSSSPTMTNCTGTGGSGGTLCHGIVIYSSSPTMMDCAGTGGSGGSTCHGIYNTENSAPRMSGCLGIGGGVMLRNVSQTISASSRQDDTYNAPGAFPYRVVAATINVTAAAAAGVTLTLRTASGGLGNAISAALAVDSTGQKGFNITGHYVIGASTAIYGRLSAADSTLAYTITLIYETCQTTCYGLYHDTTEACLIQDCDFVSNAASAAVYVTSNGDDASVFLGGTARSGLNTSGRQPAFACQSVWNPGQVYNMVLSGGSSNLTAAAGTANGTNVEV